MSNETTYALRFNGTDQYVATNLDVQPDTMPATTWEAWVRPTRLDHPHGQAILSSDERLWERLVGIGKVTSYFTIGTGTEGWQPVAADMNAWQSRPCVSSGSA